MRNMLDPYSFSIKPDTFSKKKLKNTVQYLNFFQKVLHCVLGFIKQYISKLFYNRIIRISNLPVDIYLVQRDI